MHSGHSHLPVRQRLLVLPIILFLILCLGRLFQEGLGYIYSQQSIIFLEFWYQESLDREWDGKIQPINYVNAVTGAERALGYSPDNPVFLTQLVKIYDWQGESDDLAVQYALDIYKQLILLRPAWPYYRVNFAVAKARAGELDTEFQQALLDAMKLGPWEKDVLNKVAQLGWLYRSHFDPVLQREIAKSLARYVSVYRK